MADIPKLDLQSKDIAADKQAKLKALFPEIFTEGDKVDFDKLRLTLGDSIDANDERFGLHWAGKKECFSIIQEPSIGTLKPAKEESVTWDDTENLFIEGDNLEVLKLLQKSYYGKVKMIYIDPPYNTGKEFIYPDKYQENLDTYLAYTGQVDDEGYKFSTNAETEGRFHSNWLNMMYPRLFLARNLLKEDGIVFISIGEDEVDNLKKLCIEVFGEENFLTTFIWHSKYTTSNDAKYASRQHEYVIAFAKSLENFEIGLLDRTSEMNASYRNPDNDPKGAWKATPLHAKSGSDDKVYTIEFSNGISWTAPQGRYPRYSKQSLLSIYEEGGLYFNSKGGVDKKTYLSEVKQGKTVGTLWSYKDVGSSHQANEELAKVLEKGMFDNPKPSKLIKTCMKVANLREDDIVLDFFAGSASTAQAVIDYSVEELSNINFLQIQIPEPTEKNSTPYKAGFANIAEVGKERIRRVIKRIEKKKQSLKTALQSKQTALAELEALKAKTPKLFENGKSKDLTDLENSIEELKTKIANIESTDLGFKVFKLDKSNFKIWDGSVKNDVPKQIEMAINHLEPDSKEFDILFEILLKAGFELTLPIQELTLADKKVYSVEDDALLICLENELNEEVIRAIAAKEPARFVCLDTGFKDNDQLKTNAVQIMKSHNVHDFKTV